MPPDARVMLGGADADSREIIDDKLYIFGGKASKDAFELEFKVPHDKTGEELVKSVAEAQAKKP